MVKPVTGNPPLMQIPFQIEFLQIFQKTHFSFSYLLRNHPMIDDIYTTLIAFGSIPIFYANLFRVLVIMSVAFVIMNMPVPMFMMTDMRTPAMITGILPYSINRNK